MNSSQSELGPGPESPGVTESRSSGRPGGRGPEEGRGAWAWRGCSVSGGAPGAHRRRHRKSTRGKEEGFLLFRCRPARRGSLFHQERVVPWIQSPAGQGSRLYPWEHLFVLPVLLAYPRPTLRVRSSEWKQAPPWGCLNARPSFSGLRLPTVFYP